MFVTLHCFTPSRFTHIGCIPLLTTPLIHNTPFPHSQIVRVLYEARAESAAVPTSWESADQLGDSRLQQQRAVQRLEEQRPRVLAAVQRGRDLHRDLTGAPAVLPEALEELEQAWAQSNAEVIQRLDTATGWCEGVNVWFVFGGGGAGSDWV